MQIAMADESGFAGEGRQDPYFSMAAFVADDRDWAELTVRWREALAKHKAPYLHMREFAHRIELFRGWTEDQRRALMADLLRIIAGLELYAVGAVMRVADFEALTP